MDEVSRSGARVPSHFTGKSKKSTHPLENVYLKILNLEIEDLEIEHTKQQNKKVSNMYFPF